MTNELKALDKTEAKAFRAMMNGSEANARSIFGEEGKSYIAWCAAADACYEYRKAHDLLGKKGYYPRRPRSLSTREREMTHWMSYEDRADMITTHAWEIWTKNGLNMSYDDRLQTEKSVQDVVNNAYIDDISNQDWLAAALKDLGHEEA